MPEKIQIDPEFRALLPSLTKDELANLEANIVRDGCREPLMVWNGFLADGHNRHEICTRLGLHYQVNYLDLPDRDAVMLWMLDNQGGRRNLTDIDRIAIARRREGILARRAKERQAHGGTAPGKPKNASGETDRSVEPGTTTRLESAKSAGVGEHKYNNGKVILEAVETGEAPAELLDKVRAGEVSIHKAANEIKEARRQESPPPPDSKPAKNNYRPEYGIELAEKAIRTLERITEDDRQFKAGHQKVLEYCQKQLSQ